MPQLTLKTCWPTSPECGEGEPAGAPDRGGITAFQDSTSHRPPRQVNGIVRRRGRDMKRTRKIVMAFTHADDDRWLPPRFVIGEVEVRYVPTLNYDQHLVGGVGVDETTIVPIPDSAPELIRVLKEKSSEWRRQDRALARRRARKDDSFRQEDKDKEFEVHLVREDRWEAFSAFCSEMRDENQRLTAERRAEVAELVRKHKMKVR